MNTFKWPRRSCDELKQFKRTPVDQETLEQAAALIKDVEVGGEASLRRLAEHFGDWAPGESLIIDRPALDSALAGLPADQKELLDRTATRIRAFAEAQRGTLLDLAIPIQGGVAGHRVVPVGSAGCYAPGGRYPLPSSVLMTATTARAAGVSEVWVASPKPTQVTLAAAAVAGADGLLAVGGAHAIAALVFGVGGVPSCDVVVGPGNRWVTAAKQILAGRVGIDMLAGPSELVVLADDSSDPDLIAADLLAQAEHDPDAVPILVCVDESLIPKVERSLTSQLATLPTRAIAAIALGNGCAVVPKDLDDAVALCDHIAPEHLQVVTRNAAAVGERLSRFGALFIGAQSAEVLGDYGAGPNHTLPTGGAARYSGGLSVFDFLSVRTWMHMESNGESKSLARDAAALARIEGLEGHALAAARRT